MSAARAAAIRAVTAGVAAALVTLAACSSSPATGMPASPATSMTASSPAESTSGHDHMTHGAPAQLGRPDEVPAGPQGRVGQFVVECPPSHQNFDDPIVYPDQPGASHLHQYFGNTTTDGASTYESLLAGDTTCRQPLDLAAYWVPALLDAEGRPIDPVGSVAYYRAGVGVDPVDVEPYPPGLMMIAGDAAAVETPPTSVIAWSCGTGARREAEPPSCVAPATLRLIVTFPDCWDGRRTDSADHRQHVAYASGGDCPSGHPVPIPQLQFAVDYPPVDPTGLSLASGALRSAHADFWNGWDQDKLAGEVRLCLHADLVCGVTD